MIFISGESNFSEFLMYCGPSTKSTVRALRRRNSSAPLMANSDCLTCPIWQSSGTELHCLDSHVLPYPRWIAWNPALWECDKLCAALSSFFDKMTCLGDGFCKVEPFWLCLGDCHTDCFPGIWVCRHGLSIRNLVTVTNCYRKQQKMDASRAISRVREVQGNMFRYEYAGSAGHLQYR